MLFGGSRNTSTLSSVAAAWALGERVIPPLPRSSLEGSGTPYFESSLRRAATTSLANFRQS